MKIKKLLASALSCVLIAASTMPFLTASAAITNPKPMSGQESWTADKYCESPYNVLPYADVLAAVKLEIDITATLSFDSTVNGVAGDVYIADGWNASLDNVAFCPEGFTGDGAYITDSNYQPTSVLKPQYNIEGLGQHTIVLQRSDNQPFFQTGSSNGTQIFITAFGESEFSVDAIRYYDASGNQLGVDDGDDDDDDSSASYYSLEDLISLKKYLVDDQSAEYNANKLDINLDGVVNVFDLSFLKGILLGLKTPPTPELPEGMRDISSMELVQDMTTGWNLGNTLDSYNTWTNPLTPSAQETAWGNPVTTKAMIDKVKEAGFNTVRIPTTWFTFTGDAPDYTIDEAWLDRVQEVVDYVIDNDMYCILNLHHENQNIQSSDTGWVYLLDGDEEMLTDRITKVWTQIADRFADYDDKLIFEGLNEPRSEWSDSEWVGGTINERLLLNKVNQAFVDAIRATGGKNYYRHLMVPTYAANMYDGLLGFEVPDDPVNRVIVSVHNYFPYDFALDSSGTAEWGTEQEYAQVTSVFDTLYTKLVSKGIPVVMGEYGAMNKSNEATRAEWVEYFISEGRKKGITCVWWDNGAFNGSGENFGLLNRSTLEWEYPSIIEGIMNGAQTQPEVDLGY